MRIVGILCIMMLAMPSSGLAESARVGTSGGVSLKEAKISMSLSVAYPGWKFRSTAADLKPTLHAVPWKLLASDGKRVVVKGLTEGECIGDNACKVAFNGKVIDDVDVLEAFVSIKLPTESYAGGQVVVDGMPIMLPRDFPGSSALSSGHLKQLCFIDSVGNETARMVLDEHCDFKLQDNREWNGTDFTLRLYCSLKEGRLASGDELSRVITIEAPSELRLNIGECRIEQGKEWIPLSSSIDMREGSALDFKALRGTDGFAGKYGYPVVKKGHFEFEYLPGKVQRFYGVNLVFSCNVPAEEEAERFAARLARIGYNAVRIHHHEGDLADEMTGELRPEAMRRFDAMVAACIKEGLYLTTDLYVSRKVPWRRLDVDRDGFIPVTEFKEMVLFDEKAYAEFKRFAALFLNHVNPFTGRRYAEEPALGWVSLVNEGNVGNFDMKFLVRHENQILPMWRKWLTEIKQAHPSAYADIPDSLPQAFSAIPRNEHANAFIQFLADLEAKFFNRTKSYLRDELKCRALLTNMNCWFYPAAYLFSRGNNYDYIDDHFYIDHPRFLAYDWALPSSCGNDNPFRNDTEGVPPTAVRRVFGKPFTISEYNFAAPGRFRGVGGIATGAVAALQEWDGLWRFAWSHDVEGVSQVKKSNYFDMSGDPLGLAAERASVCLFLRRDMEPLDDSACYVLPEKEVRSNLSVRGDPAQFPGRLGWQKKVGLGIGDAFPGVSEIGRYPNKVLLEGDVVGSSVRIDSKRGSFVLETPRTSGGFAENGTIKAGSLTAKLQGVAATVWASALDDSPLESSSRVLVTHLTEVQNAQSVFDDDERTILLDWGRLPHLMRAGVANIALRTEKKNATVWCLASDGARRSVIPSSVDDGYLRFVADIAREQSDATYLYEIILY